MRALPAISALAVLLTACSIANESKRLIPPEEALYLAAQNMERLQSLQGSARVSIELPQSAEGFNAQIYYQHPDSLLIRIEYLLGADAALLAIQGENYLYYNKLNDTYLRGNIHDPYIDAFLQLPLPMRDFSKLLLGRTDLDTSLQNYEVTRLEDAYLFQQSRDGQEWYYHLDMYTADVRLVEVYNRQNELLFANDFANFQSLEGFRFPQQIVFKRPRAGQYMAVYYSEIKHNQALPPGLFTFTIPASSRQLDYQDQ